MKFFPARVDIGETAFGAHVYQLKLPNPAKRRLFKNSAKNPSKKTKPNQPQ